MHWPQAFDGKSWQGDFAQKYRISAIPEVFLVGRDGVLLAKHLTDVQLNQSIAKGARRAGRWPVIPGPDATCVLHRRRLTA